MFTELQRAELARAQGQHPPIHSGHEAFGVLQEELEEFWLEVKKRPHERNRAQMLTELVQIAATAQRIAEDLKLLRFAPNGATAGPVTIGNVPNTSAPQTGFSCVNGQWREYEPVTGPDPRD